MRSPTIYKVADFYPVKTVGGLIRNEKANNGRHCHNIKRARFSNGHIKLENIR